MPPDIIPGRMALLVTLFLVLVNIFNTVTTNTPKAEGLTAIEIWMLSCLLFVFGALVGELDFSPIDTLLVSYIPQKHPLL